MEDILEELFTMICFSGSNDKKGGCLVPTIILLIIVGLCAAWFYFYEG